MPSQSQVVTDAVGTSLTNWKHKLAATIAEAQAAGEIVTRTNPERLAQVLDVEWPQWYAENMTVWLNERGFQLSSHTA